MFRNEKSREGLMSRSIARNHLSLPLNRITVAEGIVLCNYGMLELPSCKGSVIVS
jgi:hypothetical protein